MAKKLINKSIPCCKCGTRHTATFAGNIAEWDCINCPTHNTAVLNPTTNTVKEKRHEHAKQ